MPDFGIGEALLSLAAAGAGEAGAAAAPAALGVAEAAAPAAIGAGLGSAEGLAAAGLPFAAGAGELGSVATGLGPAGVSGFGEAAAISGALGASGLGGVTSAGIPLAAGIEAAGAPALGGVTAGLPALGYGGGGLTLPGIGAGGSLDLTTAPAALTGTEGISTTGSIPTSASTGAFATPSASTAASSASTGGGLSDWLSKNAGTLGLGALGIGGSVLAPSIMKSLGLQPQLPNQPQLNANATQAGQTAQSLIAQEKALTDPLTTGTLPAAQEQQVQNAQNDAIAAVKSKYAAMGLSGSTMEAEAINNVKNQALAMKATIESQLAQTGLQMGQQALTAMNLQDQVYTTLMNATLSQDKALQDAISKFASAAALGSALNTKKA